MFKIQIDMRQLLLSIALLLSMSAGAQVKSYGTKDGVYEEIVNCELTKAQLWSNLKRWIATSFVSYKHTVDMEDREAGTVIVKYNIKEYASTYTDAITTATLQVDVKENKFRIRISDPSFGLKPNGMAKDTSWMPEEDLEEVIAEMEACVTLVGCNIKNYDALLNAKEEIRKRQEATRKYTSPKNKKKDIVNPTYRKYEIASRIASSLEVMYTIHSREIAGSLKKGMVYNNDF